MYHESIHYFQGLFLRKKAELLDSGLDGQSFLHVLFSRWVEFSLQRATIKRYSISPIYCSIEGIRIAHS